MTLVSSLKLSKQREGEVFFELCDYLDCLSLECSLSEPHDERIMAENLFLADTLIKVVKVMRLVGERLYG